MMIKLDLSVSDPAVIQQNLEKPCCGEKLTHECETHFLTSFLKCQLKESIAEDSNGVTAKIIAELAKFSSCREFLFDESILSSLVKNLGGKPPELLLQSCRALANLCYENEEAQKVILEKGGVEAITAILVKPFGGSDAEKQLRAAAVGFLLNLVTENAEVQQKVSSGDLPSRLLDFAKSEVESNNVTTLSQHVILVLVTLAESSPMEQVLTLPVCQIAVKLLSVCQGDAFYIPALQFLEDDKVADEVKERLVEAGLLELLMAQIEAHPAHPTEEEAGNLELIGKVISNILTGDGAMEQAYKSERLNLVDRLKNWLQSEHYMLAYSSALCLGNVARTDLHSQDIVNRGVHKHVLTCLKRQFCDIKMQHALLGTLRNLAIPKENKKKLVDDGVLDVTMPLVSLDVRLAGPVVHKLVGVWRQIVVDEPQFAVMLGTNAQLIKQLVHWAETAMSPWVPGESLRLLSALITRSRDRKVAETLVCENAFPEISKLLTSQHGVMQMEAVNALTVAGALLLGTESKFEEVLVEAALEAKIKLLLKTPNITPQLLENLLTMLTTLAKYEKIRLHLLEGEVWIEVKSTLESMKEYHYLLQKLEDLNR